VEIVRDGYRELPGPLSLAVIAKDGTVYLVGYGRANHAGSGDNRVLQAVMAEDPLPAPVRRDTDGNARFYGFECENLGDGKDPWPDVQVDAIVRASAALERAHGWGTGPDSAHTSTIGHKEWTDQKIDPYGPIGTTGGPALTMPLIRARVAERLTHPANWTPKESPMTISDADAKKIAKAVLTLDGEIAAPWGTATNQEWQLNSCVTHLMKAVLRTEKAVQELSALGAARDVVLAHLVEGGGLDAAEVERAAQAGATAALDRLAIALATEEEG
jgi:hypothetical protein